MNKDIYTLYWRATGRLLCRTSSRPLYTIVLLSVRRDILGTHTWQNKHSRHHKYVVSSQKRGPERSPML